VLAITGRGSPESLRAADNSASARVRTSVSYDIV